MKLIIIAAIILVINLPFGYWRGGQRKYSLKWIIAIHIPVPIIILIRIYSEVGFAWYTYPIFVAAFFAGQMVGAPPARRHAAPEPAGSHPASA